MKSVIKGTYKANVGAGAETFWKSEGNNKFRLHNTGYKTSIVAYT